jgi:hypothetical protein
MTRREKILLCSACFALVIFLVARFVIQPLGDGLIEKRSELERLNEQKLDTEMKINSENYIRQELEFAAEAVTELLEIYPLNIPNELIDPIVTNLCLRHNLVPVALTITEASDFRADEQDENEYPPAFRLAGANVTLRGSYHSFRNLLIDTADIKYIRVSNFAFSADSMNDDSSTISASFEIYMLSDAVNRE